MNAPASYPKLSIFISSFLLGSVPCFIFVAKNSSQELADFVKSIDVSDPTVLYLLVLLLTQLVASFLGYYKPGHKSDVKQRFRFYYSIVNSVGPGIILLTQVVSGAIFAVASMAAWKHKETGIYMVVALGVMWLLFFTGAIYLDRINRYAENLQS